MCNCNGAFNFSCVCQNPFCDCSCNGRFNTFNNGHCGCWNNCNRCCNQNNFYYGCPNCGSNRYLGWYQ